MYNDSFNFLLKSNLFVRFVNCFVTAATRYSHRKVVTLYDILLFLFASRHRINVDTSGRSVKLSILIFHLSLGFWPGQVTSAHGLQRGSHISFRHSALQMGKIKIPFAIT
jgi:hypothetical protein